MAAEAQETQTCLPIVSNRWTGFSARSHPFLDLSTSKTTQYSLLLSFKGSFGYRTRRLLRMISIVVLNFLKLEYEEGRIRADSVSKKEEYNHERIS